MAENVARLCQVLPIKQVAEYFGLSWDTVKAVDRVRVDEANRQLTTVYVLKDDLKHLWDYVYEGAARRFWEQWYNRAVFSRTEPLRTCPRTRAGAPFPGAGLGSGIGSKEVRPAAEGIPSWHPCPLPLATPYQPLGRNQQQDQSHQADGLWLPRRRLLLSQDSSGFSRKYLKNQK